MSTGEEFLTVAEIAARLRVTEAAVRQWLQQGALVGYKLAPKAWRVKQADFEQFLSERRNKGGG